jgi:hypothetical protein
MRVRIFNLLSDTHEVLRTARLKALINWVLCSGCSHVFKVSCMSLITKGQMMAKGSRPGYN